MGDSGRILSSAYLPKYFLLMGVQSSSEELPFSASPPCLSSESLGDFISPRGRVAPQAHEIRICEREARVTPV